MKKCRYCGEPIEYVSNASRGYWAGKSGRICPIATDEFKTQVGHIPEWDTVNKTWKDIL